MTTPRNRPPEEPRETRPLPDPTVLTTEALHREIGQLKEHFGSQLSSMEKFFSDKLDTMEKYRIEQQKGTKEALDAALQAAKEAVGEQNKSNALANAKMETAFTKQIDAIGVQIQSNNKGIDDKVGDLKDRVIAGESRSKGIGEGWGIMVAAIGVVALIAGVVIGVIGLVHHP